MRNTLLILFVSAFTTLFAQKNVFLDITPKVNGSNFTIGENLSDLTGTDFNLSHFDYYLSNVMITHDGGQVLILTPEVYLMEPENHTIYLGLLNVTDIESIAFGVGVPANINTINGADAIDISAYPAGHPLSFQDPSMHWGWSSGYIHMIVGGDADSNGDNVPDKIFEIHSLGDNTYANVSLPVVETNSSPDQIDIMLNCHLDRWLIGADLATVDILHGSTGINYTVMHNAEISNVFDQPLTASSPAIPFTTGKAWFYNHSETLEFFWEGIKNVDHFELIDVQGRVVEQGNITDIKGSKRFAIPQGSYALRFLDMDGSELKKINVVR